MTLFRWLPGTKKSDFTRVVAIELEEKAVFRQDTLRDIVKFKQRPPHIDETTWNESILDSALFINNCLKRIPTLEEKLHPKKVVAKRSAQFLLTIGVASLMGFGGTELMLICLEASKNLPKFHEDAKELFGEMQYACPGVFSVSNESCSIVPYYPCASSSCEAYNWAFRDCYTYGTNRFDRDTTLFTVNPYQEFTYNAKCAQSIKDRMKLCASEKFTSYDDKCMTLGTVCALGTPASSFLYVLMIFLPFIIYNCHKNSRKNALLKSPGNFLYGDYETEITDSISIGEIRSFLEEELQRIAKTGSFDANNRFIKTLPSVVEVLSSETKDEVVSLAM